MFRVKFLQKSFGNYLQLRRSYLSHEFKDVMLKSELVPTRSDPTAAISVDYFINNLANTEYYGATINACELFLKLRTKPEAYDVFESINYGVVRHFVDSNNIQELLLILWNRLDYGVFIDNFTGCYLMDQLLAQQNYSAATQVAMQLMIQEDTSNKLVAALSLKSCFEYLKQYITTAPAAPAQPTKPASKSAEKKVRVKFLRNHVIADMNSNNYALYLIGKTLLKMSQNSPKDIQYNTSILGMLLCNQYEECAAAIKADTSICYKDVLQLCDELLKTKTNIPAELTSILAESLANTNVNVTSFDDKLTLLVKEAIDQEESTLIEKQKENYGKWLQLRDKDLSKYLELDKRAAPDIDSIIKDIDLQKQKLWFFDTEDKLDLQIYSKVVRYPKRWFGKKKVPKAIDDNYVPPEATKKIVK